VSFLKAPHGGFHVDVKMAEKNFLHKITFTRIFPQKKQIWKISLKKFIKKTNFNQHKNPDSAKLHFYFICLAAVSKSFFIGKI
jgi:hypothetical protein